MTAPHAASVKETQALRVIPSGAYAAAIFDLDGVLTRTARAHAAAWKRLFDDYLEERGRAEGRDYAPFDIDDDYRAYVDGLPRYDGVRAFLEARGIELPEGDPGDPPEADTVRGLGNRKNALFLERLHAGGVEVYEDAVDFLRRVRAAGIATAVVSSSRNCGEVIRVAGIAGLLDARVDGNDLGAGLAGKPAPDMFVEAARRLGSAAPCAMMFEDAAAGVRAGRAGGLGLVIGVDRAGAPGGLAAEGADWVIDDFSRLRLDGEPGDWPADALLLPSALSRVEALGYWADRRPIAVFLDYDGTLTPIVERPEDALLAPATRAAVETLAARCLVAVVSGRDLDDVRALVGIDTLYYAGSHGFDIEGPDVRRAHPAAEGQVDELAAAAAALERGLAGIAGAQVERKRFAVAVHDRRVAEAERARVAEAVGAVAAEHPQLRRTGGKRVHELRPGVDWDKGRAIRWLLEALCPGEPPLALYLGDDETDEDAFAALRSDGVPVLVAEAPRATRARYRLSDPDAVRRFLSELAGMLGDGR